MTNQTQSPKTSVMIENPSVKSDQTQQKIGGYLLEQKIGSGGFGEVWRANAPGGIKKAIKIVYGTVEEARAVSELKSLERIKEARHPFLLTLERIEQIDGRLIIVTELADGSLGDVYKECRDAGHAGISRDQLLEYLRDAADALDYMFEVHSLAHLDVKPENLLLIGNRVKVGDFGLTKDLRDVSVSMMAGLTPLYSPPEVFEGRPSRQSDQYSLAIVYQILLTGAAPFGGRTAAQLTAQHLRSAPDLGPLPTGDRATVSRALSKIPQRRFSSCRAMIDQLIQRGNSPRGVRSESKPREKPGHSRRPATNSTSARSLTRRGVVSRTSEFLPRVALSQQNESHRPMVFIGVGGLAGRLLWTLRSFLAKRFGPETDLPSVGMLYLDSDVDAIKKACLGTDDGSLRLAETLPIPLRYPREYRNDSEQILEWLGRRWLYNIPRTLRTDGLRPLGRLAFVDHLDQIQSRVGDLIDSVLSSEALGATSAATKLHFGPDSPRVYVVASTSGGTGSGAVLDLVSVVNRCLKDLGIEPYNGCGVFLHSDICDATASSVSIGNTLAFLREYRHYLQRQGCTIDTLTSGNSTLSADDFLLAHNLLISLDPRRATTETNSDFTALAEFLLGTAFGQTREYFDLIRSDKNFQDRSADRQRSFRTVGVSLLDKQSPLHAEWQTAQTCLQLVRYWIEGTKPAGGEDSETIDLELTSSCQSRLNEELDRLRLNEQAVLDDAQSTIDGDLGATVDRYFRDLISDSMNADASSQRVGFDSVDLLFADATASSDEESQIVGLTEWRQKLTQSTRSGADGLRELIWQRLNQPGSRLCTATAAKTVLCEHLKQVESALVEVADECTSECVQLRDSAPNVDRRGGWRLLFQSAKRPDERLEWQTLVQQYAKTKLREFVHRQWAHSIRAIRNSLNDLDESFDVIRQRLHSLMEDLQSSKIEVERQCADATFLPIGAEVTEPVAPKVIEIVDTKIQHCFNEIDRTYGEVLIAESFSPIALRDWMRDAVVEVNTSNENCHRSPHTTTSNQPEKLHDELAQVPEPFRSAIPHLVGVGGGQRWLLTGGSQRDLEQWTASIPAGLRDSLTILPNSRGEAFACCEVQGISVDHLIDVISRDSEESLKLAKELHTRRDIQWD